MREQSDTKVVGGEEEEKESGFLGFFNECGNICYALINND